MIEDLEDQLRLEFPIAMREVPFIECGGGWGELIRECVAAAERASIPLDQIKEKYGELRVYVGGDGVAPANLKKAIKSAEARSRTICEICGAAGAWQVVNRFALTRCKVHDPKFRENRIAEVVSFLRDKEALAKQGVTIDRYVFDATADEFEEAVRRAKE